jgi:hydrogenase maturation protease
MAPQKNRDKMLLIGVGNLFRHDDALGLEGAKRLKKKKLKSLEVWEHSGDGAALMEAWQGRERVILLDATSSGSAPGTIFSFDGATQPLPSQFKASSSHAFGLAEAVEMARALGRLPKVLRVLGVEGRDFTPGQGLSPEVAASLDQVVQSIVELCKAGA